MTFWWNSSGQDAYAHAHKRAAGQDRLMGARGGRLAVRVAGQARQQVGLLAAFPGSTAACEPVQAAKFCPKGRAILLWRPVQKQPGGITPASAGFLAHRWSSVAKKIPGRTGQQCAQRWRHKVRRQSAGGHDRSREAADLAVLVARYACLRSPRCTLYMGRGDRPSRQTGLRAWQSTKADEERLVGLLG